MSDRDNQWRGDIYTSAHAGGYNEAKRKFEPIIDDLRAQLRDEQAAREQAEAACGELREVIEEAIPTQDVITIKDGNFVSIPSNLGIRMRKALQSPAAKAGKKLETLLNAASLLISWVVVMKAKEKIVPNELSEILEARMKALDEAIGNFDQDKVFGVEITIEPYEGVK
jgi:hypothetical protein